MAESEGLAHSRQRGVSDSQHATHRVRGQDGEEKACLTPHLAVRRMDRECMIKREKEGGTEEKRRVQQLDREGEGEDDEKRE